jgi:hypothetical protein
MIYIAETSPLLQRPALVATTKKDQCRVLEGHPSVANGDI